MLLVITIAAHGAAAVIPEDQLIAVGREVLFAPFDKAGQSLRVGHRTVPVVGDKALDGAVLHLINLVGPGADDIVLPFCAAAGVKDHIYFI